MLDAEYYILCPCAIQHAVFCMLNTNLVAASGFAPLTLGL